MATSEIKGKVRIKTLTRKLTENQLLCALSQEAMGGGCAEPARDGSRKSPLWVPDKDAGDPSWGRGAGSPGRIRAPGERQDHCSEADPESGPSLEGDAKKTITRSLYLMV